MKMNAIVAVLGLAVCGVVMGEGGSVTTTMPATTQSALQTESQKIGYAIGLKVGAQLKGLDVDTAALAAGVRDAASGAKPQLTEKEQLEAFMALQKKVIAAQAAQMEANQKVGEAFLAENAKKEGVKTTASGLQYKVIQSGKGKTPKATDIVSVNYRGTLVSGREFDASHGEPVTFPVDHVIAGWTEALQMMKEGDKWMLYIPSKLAYKEQGAGDTIGPNETLIFEVELVAVK
ncbi:MAG: FKBP-type peptidyl-prolyl cis-trans isomerase [Phycisphaerales bacterium]|nr:FKBP-type peptidyl-prolyl cis-trans isomerase [Phycisphaerales bacterium]